MLLLQDDEETFSKGCPGSSKPQVGINHLAALDHDQGRQQRGASIAPQRGVTCKEEWVSFPALVVRFTNLTEISTTFSTQPHVA